MLLIALVGYMCFNWSCGGSISKNEDINPQVDIQVCEHILEINRMALTCELSIMGVFFSVEGT